MWTNISVMFPRLRSRERRNELITVWDLKQVWKHVLFTWRFKTARYFNGHMWAFHFGQCFAYYFITRIRLHFCQKWLTVKMTDMKSIREMNFKSTCKLNEMTNESVLVHFISDKFCSHENLMPVWNFISVKINVMKPLQFCVLFLLKGLSY